MNQIYFKRSAIHNLVITSCRNEFKKDEVSEGLVIPKSILKKSDILPWEQITVTKISGGNWNNRIKTFVLEGDDNGEIEARGSLASFLTVGDLTCLISRTILDQRFLNLYKNNQLPIFDLGFDPEKKENLAELGRLDIEHSEEKQRDVKQFDGFALERNELPRIMLSSLVLSLEVNKTHPDCLQGSAELPREIMNAANLNRYQSVSVYNRTKGGIADTYAVPMPAGVIMTTGAMATFAGIGEAVNIASYKISTDKISPEIIFTDGTKLA